MKLKRIVTASFFAAVIFVFVSTIKFPLGGGGYVNIGDAFIYLAACFLPLPYAMAAGAIGAGLSDFFSPYAIYTIATIIIKPLLTVGFNYKHDKIICKRNVIAVIIASFVGVLGYFIFEVILYGQPYTALINAVQGLTQPLVCAILFILAGLAMDRANVKKRIGMGTWL